MLGVRSCKPMRKGFGPQTGRDEIVSKVYWSLLELSVKEPIRDAWIGCSQLQRMETELGMKFPIVAHCRMQNGNCKRKCRQAQTGMTFVTPQNQP